MDPAEIARAEKLLRTLQLGEQELLCQYFRNQEKAATPDVQLLSGLDVIAGGVDLSLLDIELHKLNKRMYVHESLADLRGRGFERHLTSLEAFTVLFDAEINPNSMHRQLRDNMLSGIGEWLDDSLMKKGGNIYSAQGCTFTRNEDASAYVLVGEPRNVVVYTGCPTNVDNWYPVQVLPEKFVQEKWGRSRKDLERYSAGLHIRSDGIWRPVARGGVIYFDLGAGVSQWASRGGRRKSA
jgi:hypothetical protein